MFFMFASPFFLLFSIKVKEKFQKNWSTEVFTIWTFFYAVLNFQRTFLRCRFSFSFSCFFFRFRIMKYKISVRPGFKLCRARPQTHTPIQWVQSVHMYKLCRQICESKTNIFLCCTSCFWFPTLSLSLSLRRLVPVERTHVRRSTLLSERLTRTVHLRGEGGEGRRHYFDSVKCPLYAHLSAKVQSIAI